MAATNPAQPDALADIEARTPQALHPILEAAFTYRKQLVLGVVAILAVAAAYAGYQAYDARSRASAQTELGDILMSTSGSETLTRLDGLIGSAPDSVKPAVVLEAAQTAMTLGDYAKASGYWETLVGATEGEMQFVARLGRAKAMLLSDRAADALKEMNELVGLASAAYTVPVYRQLALTAEAAGDTAQALTAYKKLIEEKVGDTPFIEYKISRLESK